MSSLLEATFDRLLRRGRHARANGSGAGGPADQRAAARRPTDSGVMLEWFDENEQLQAELVHLRNRSEQGLGFQARCAIAEGTPVLLTPTEGAVIKGVVKHSRRNGAGGFDHGMRVVSKERRRHDRAPLDQTARLEVVGLVGADLLVRIKDASEGGVQLESPAEVPVGSPVRVKHRGWERHGVVVHVQPRGGAFRVGVQFIGEATPSLDD